MDLLHHQNAPHQLNEYKLTCRENEVISQMIEGASYKMIADHLGIAYDTVHNHVRNIYRKLKVNSMSEAVAKVLKNPR